MFSRAAGDIHPSRIEKGGNTPFVGGGAALYQHTRPRHSKTMHEADISEGNLSPLGLVVSGAHCNADCDLFVDPLRNNLHVPVQFRHYLWVRSGLE